MRIVAIDDDEEEVSAVKMVPTRASSSRDPSDAPPRNGELLVPAFVFWAACLARVVGGIVVDPVFGAEPTVAAVLVFVLPWALREPLVSLVRRPFTRRQSFTKRDSLGDEFPEAPSDRP